MLGERCLEQRKGDEGNGNQTAEIDGDSEAQALCERSRAIAEGSGEKRAPLVDAGEDECEQDPLEQHGRSVMPNERGSMNVRCGGAGSAHQRGEREQREERHGMQP